VLLCRDLLEDATLEFPHRAALSCLGSGGPPSISPHRQSLLRVLHPLCFLLGASLVFSPVCELCWSIPGGGRPLVACAAIVLSRRSRWLLFGPCRVSTASTMYPTLRLLLPDLTPGGCYLVQRIPHFVCSQLISPLVVWKKKRMEWAHAM
jgi:hypothetical protein